MGCPIKLIYFFLVLIILSTAEHAQAAQAITIAFATPLYSEKNTDSKILQELKKGTLLFVPNEFARTDKFPKFIETITRDGGIAYVLSDYIKIITNDENEEAMPISLRSDPSDNRLPEPVSKTYPFDTEPYRISSVFVNVEVPSSSPYSYTIPIQSMNESPYSIGLQGNAIYQVKNILNNRFYFGLIGSINNYRNNLTLNGNIPVNESSIKASAGPMGLYKFYVAKNIHFYWGGGVLYNYHNTQISSTNGGETISLSGFVVSGFLSLLGSVELIPKLDLSIMLTGNIAPPFMQTMKGSFNSTFWGDAPNTFISTPAKMYETLSIGLAIHY